MRRTTVFKKDGKYYMKLTIEIERFSGVEEILPEVVYVPFKEAEPPSVRKFHENAWAASINGEVTLIDEDLGQLLSNLRETVLTLLASEEAGFGNSLPLETEDMEDEEEEVTPQETPVLFHWK